MKKLFIVLIFVVLGLSCFGFIACKARIEPPKEEEQQVAPADDNETEENEPEVDEFADKNELTSGFYVSKTANEYFIYTKAGLENFAALVGLRVFKNATVKLKADIEYDNEWTSLEILADKSKGLVFDGLGHTISGLELVPTVNAVSGNSPVGFFGIVRTDLTVKNVTFKNVTLKDGVTYAKWAGIVVGYHKGSNLFIENVKVENCEITPTASGSKKIGGIVGFSSDELTPYNITIKNCSVTGCKFSGSISVGGISGTILNYYDKIIQEDDSVIIENCSVKNCVFSAGSVVGAFVVDETHPSVTEEENEILFTAKGCSKENNGIN